MRACLLYASLVVSHRWHVSGACITLSSYVMYGMCVVWSSHVVYVVIPSLFVVFSGALDARWSPLSIPHRFPSLACVSRVHRTFVVCHVWYGSYGHRVCRVRAWSVQRPWLLFSCISMDLSTTDHPGTAGVSTGIRRATHMHQAMSYAHLPLCPRVHAKCGQGGPPRSGIDFLESDTILIPSAR